VRSVCSLDLRRYLFPLIVTLLTFALIWHARTGDLGAILLPTDTSFWGWTQAYFHFGGSLLLPLTLSFVYSSPWFSRQRVLLQFFIILVGAWAIHICGLRFLTIYNSILHFEPCNAAGEISNVIMRGADWLLVSLNWTAERVLRTVQRSIELKTELLPSQLHDYLVSRIPMYTDLLAANRVAEVNSLIDSDIESFKSRVEVIEALPPAKKGWIDTLGQLVCTGKDFVCSHPVETFVVVGGCVCLALFYFGFFGKASGGGGGGSTNPETAALAARHEGLSTDVAALRTQVNGVAARVLRVETTGAQVGTDLVTAQLQTQVGLVRLSEHNNLVSDEATGQVIEGAFASTAHAGQILLDLTRN
jgi:hypothetical protein